MGRRLRLKLLAAGTAAACVGLLDLGWTRQTHREDGVLQAGLTCRWTVLDLYLLSDAARTTVLVTVGDREWRWTHP